MESDSEILDNISEMSSNDQRLDNTIMMALTENQIEMFIVLLHSLENIHHSEVLKCLDVINSEGNNLLHLAAMLRPSGEHFCKIIMNFSSEKFKKMLNKKNYQGDTPLHIAVANANLKVLEFLLDNGQLVPNITLKNNSGLTVLEYINRYFYGSF